MSLSSTCIKRPVLATVLNLILVIVGSIGLLYLGVRDYPSVDPPVISVSTSFVGLTPMLLKHKLPSLWSRPLMVYRESVH